MPKLNQPLCASSYGNTGYGDCFLDPGKFIGAIQVPKEFAIAEADIPSLRAFLESKISAGIGLRIYPYHNFITITDNTEDATINTTDYGTRIVTREGYYDWTFRYLVGGVQLHQELAKNAGPSKYFLFYDDKGYLYGYKSEGKLKGIPVDNFFVPPWRPNTGADAANYSLRFMINPIYMNQGNLGFLKVDFNLFDIQGLQTVNVTLNDMVGNVAYVSLATAVSGVNLHEAYANVLNAAAAWVATNKQTGAPIAITGVVANDGNDGQFVVTFNAGAISAMDEGDKIGLKLVSAEDLSDTYNIDGFESLETEITIPGS
jgi:hypothetical protein